MAAHFGSFILFHLLGPMPDTQIVIDDELMDYECCVDSPRNHYMVCDASKPFLSISDPVRPAAGNLFLTSGSSRMMAGPVDTSGFLTCIYS